MEDIDYWQRDSLEIWRRGEHPELEAEWFVPFLDGRPPVEPVKDSHSRKTYRWQSPAGRVYVKLFTYAASDRWGDWLREMFDWKRYGHQQFERLLQLKENGFNVARPLLALERREGWLKRSSLVVLEQIKGTSLSAYLKEASVEEAYDFFERGLKVLQRMHALNIAYGDTKLDNLLMDEEAELAWTDYDDLKVDYRWLPSKLRDLRRYLQSWLKLSRKEERDICETELIERFHCINPRSMLVKKFIVHRARKQL